MRNLNLFLAVFWLVLGAGLVVWHWLDPQSQFLRIRGTDWSPGWFGIVLALYNLVRWYSIRSSYLQRQALQEQWQRFQERERERLREPVEPDPNFNFNDAPEGEKRPGA
jgi:hypothetical protein